MSILMDGEETGGLWIINQKVQLQHLKHTARLSALSTVEVAARQHSDTSREGQVVSSKQSLKLGNIIRMEPYLPAYFTDACLTPYRLLFGVCLTLNRRLFGVYWAVVEEVFHEVFGCLIFAHLHLRRAGHTLWPLGTAESIPR